MLIIQERVVIKTTTVYEEIRECELAFEQALILCKSEEEMDELTELYHQKIEDLKNRYKYVAKKYRKR